MNYWLGWIANAFLIAGYWYVGEYKRWSFILTAIGELLWLLVAINSQSKEAYAMIFICVVFTAIAAVNWVKWGKEKQQNANY